MPKINVEVSSSKTPEDAFFKVQQELSRGDEFKRLDPNFVLTFDDENLTGSASGSQFSANLAIKPSGEGSVTSIGVDLSFKLGLVKGVVKDRLEKKLSQILS